MHTWIQLPHSVGPFDLHRGDRVLHGGRWRVVVDLTAPHRAGRGRVLRCDDGRLSPPAYRSPAEAVPGHGPSPKRPILRQS